MSNSYVIKALCITLLLVVATPVFAAFDNLRWSVDLSSKALVNAQDKNDAFVHAIGLDLHNVFTGQNGDWGTLVWQTYLSRVDGLTKHPKHFSDSHDWAMTYRSLYFQFNAPNPNLPNLKIGHFELPAGLESTIDTQGSVRQYNHGRNYGVKADWGIELNQQHYNFEYALSYTLGGGQSLNLNQGDSVVVARVGSSSYANQIYGISLAKSEINDIEHQRVALDGQWHRGLWSVLAELGLNKTNESRHQDLLLEFNWRTGNEDYLWYVQGNYQNTAQSTSHHLSGGLRYEPNQHLSLSAQIKQALNSQAQTQLTLQFRYRY